MAKAGRAGGRTVAPAALQAWVDALLQAAGLEASAAATVAASLLDASVRGVDSHGVARAPLYVRRLQAGGINANPRPRVLREDGAVAVVDADDGPGQVAGVLAADLSVDLARRHGTGVVVVHGSSHYGAAGYYVVRAARQGMVALSTTNADPFVVPFGGRERGLGTNPIAFAAPTSDGVFVLDMATSQVAVNRIVNARDEGRAIPEGWAVDEAGVGVTDPNAMYAAVPVGGYKGFGLALMVEILSGVLAGAAVRHEIGALHDADDHHQRLGHFHLAIDPERTVGRERFAAVLDYVLDDLRAIPPAPGHGEVLVAGDPEERTQRERARTGVPLPAVLVAELEALSRELGVAVPA